ncbi:hypothetical protein [Methanoculleus chikugoensis]|uniref:hypothetical protein n=1 Tax=Methanoculleus chikugoensis TaxID=118126 RepID=UPI000B0C4831|nr:hypothetical protein [Methanoculleus chikugoensis]
MEDLLAALLDIEKRAWEAADTRNVEFYRDYLAPEALVVSPPGGHPGQGRDPPRSRGEPPQRTSGVRHHGSEGRALGGEESAVLAYTVSFGGQILFVSTVYARAEGRWRAAFHQRTPASPVAGTMD